MRKLMTPVNIKQQCKVELSVQWPRWETSEHLQRDSLEKRMFSCLLFLAFTLCLSRCLFPRKQSLQHGKQQRQMTLAFKKKCQTSPSSGQRIHSGGHVSCSSPAVALTSWGSSWASRGAEKARTSIGNVLVLISLRPTQVQQFINYRGEQRQKRQKDGRLSKYKLQTHNRELSGFWIITHFSIMRKNGERKARFKRKEDRKSNKIIPICQGFGDNMTTVNKLRYTNLRLSKTQLYAFFVV